MAAVSKQKCILNYPMDRFQIRFITLTAAAELEARFFRWDFEICRPKTEICLQKK